MSKHSVTIRRLRVVTTCWSWAWSNRTSPSKWVGLGSPLAACSVYGDLTCSVHTVNNLCMFNCQSHFYLCNRGPYVRLAFVPNMLSAWNKDIIIITPMNHFKQPSQTNKQFCPSEPINVHLQCQTGRPKVDLAFVQTQPLPPHLTVAEPEDLLQQNFNAF